MSELGSLADCLKPIQDMGKSKWVNGNRYISALLAEAAISKLYNDAQLQIAIRDKLIEDMGGLLFGDDDE